MSLPDDNFDPVEQSERYRKAFESVQDRTDAAADRIRNIILRDWSRFCEKYGTPIDLDRYRK